MSDYSYDDRTSFNSGYLAVSPVHRIYYEEYGCAVGRPVIFLHGGPGGSTSKASCRFFNPEKYRVVLLDQRGAGKSLPSAELQENTTQHLVEDVEKLRGYLGLEKWMVFGGSWGSTLALAYAQAHPEAVTSMVLYGIMAAEPIEINRLCHGTVSDLFFPQEYEAWLHFLPPEKRDDPVSAYYALLTDDDRATRLAAARSWNKLELMLAQLVAPPDVYKKLANDDWVLSHARLEAHYFANDCFLRPGQLLDQDNIKRIQHIPTYIVQGRYDVLCVPKVAWTLHQKLPNSILHWIPDAGHASLEPGTNQKLVAICNDLAAATQ